MGAVHKYLLVMNVVSFVTFAIDKRKAVCKKHRISEKILMALAILGGSLGALVSMRVFRHKTKKACFLYGIPLILTIQTVLFIYISYIY